MPLEFYNDLASQPCRALYMFLKAANVPFVSNTISLLKGETKSPEFLKMNPFHKVPIIDDNGFILTETVAIMRYIAVKYDIPDHLYPRADPEKQARCDEFLNWHHTGLRKHCIDAFLSILRSRIGVGAFTKITIEPEKLETLKQATTAAVNEFANYFLKGKPFICGDEVSAADLIAINEIVQFDAIGEQGLYTCNDEVAKWVERVKKCMHPYFDEASGSLLRIAEMYKNAPKE